MVKHVIEENHIHSLDLLHAFYFVGSDVEPALENLKLTILERIELQTFFNPSQAWWGQIRTFPPRKFPVVLQKLKYLC